MHGGDEDANVAKVSGATKNMTLSYRFPLSTRTQMSSTQEIHSWLRRRISRGRRTGQGVAAGGKKREQDWGPTHAYKRSSIIDYAQGLKRGAGDRLQDSEDEMVIMKR